MTETKARFTPEQLRYKASTFGNMTTAKMLLQAANDAEVLERMTTPPQPDLESVIGRLRILAGDDAALSSDVWILGRAMTQLAIENQELRERAEVR